METFGALVMIGGAGSCYIVMEPPRFADYEPSSLPFGHFKPITRFGPFLFLIDAKEDKRRAL